MALATQLATVLDGFNRDVPSHIKDPINTARSEVITTFPHSAAIQPGATLPSFSLANASGGKTTSAELLAKSPILITFYRGGWCPFCNLALHDLQVNLEAFKAKGVPSTAEKNELQFIVLSDVGNKFARQLGIVWKQPETMRPALKAIGTDLRKHNGDDSLEVPVPCTLLVDQRGVVRNAHVEPDYTKRLDSKVALGWADAL
ncbi:hypothetical protein LTR91_015453 [Friedmanniomyces endolithicus]|uniref:Thioredoxin domain-containing protein n=1 Tax=Friedmanniomyces endolithicus TaxID=329885 RepID=A0AAN6QM63_9PEZI|nr:hypothetical protein LTR57_017510 [Friedmanniomyces endolithicus]KAK0971719.1 hypothetical protein LTR91_015453 [Friedmanniomyces endolithicus]KAK0990195.1 hypothetical protein LTS01_008610 [Friedmanniomyces endolithicus]KAK1030051.1 hypothetical protein LTS16_019239 [Friedmanniomyces endolithicus]